MTKVKDVFSASLFTDSKDPSVEHLLIIENLNKVKVIQDKMAEELFPLKERQNLVSLYHKVLKEINLLIEGNSQLDGKKFQEMINTIQEDLEKKMADEKLDLESKLEFDPSIQEKLDKLLEKYKPSFDFLSDTLKMGDEIKKNADFFTKEQRDRLIDNLRMDMDDLNILNDMQLQKVSRLNNETYESYQNARLMLKTIHDAFISIIQKWK